MSDRIFNIYIIPANIKYWLRIFCIIPVIIAPAIMIS